MSSEWLIWVGKFFGSDIAVGFYIMSTVILIPLSIYFIKRGNWKERGAGYIIIGLYLLLTLVIVGLLGQMFMGNGINVLVSGIFLLTMLIYLNPDRDIVTVV